MPRVKMTCWLLSIVLALVSLSGCSSPFYESFNAAGSRLSSDRMNELRKEYPLSTGVPATINMREVSFNEVMAFGDGVVVAEVLKVLPSFRVELSTKPGTPERKVADKDRANGITSYQPEFISYQVKVNEVVTGEDVEKDTFLFYNADFAGVEPELKPGMKIIAVVKKGQQENKSEAIHSPVMAHTLLSMMTMCLPRMRESRRKYSILRNKRMAYSWTFLWIKSRTCQKASGFFRR